MLSWIGRLIGRRRNQADAGVSLEGEWAWQMQAPRDPAAFIRQLPHLFPEEVIIYLEGTGMAADVVTFLESRRAENPTAIACGTVWPKPNVFHLAATVENVDALARLFTKHEPWERCDHLHVYQNEAVYLQWHDVNCGDPLLLSARLDEERVADFARGLGCAYQLTRDI